MWKNWKCDVTQSLPPPPPVTNCHTFSDPLPLGAWHTLWTAPWVVLEPGTSRSSARSANPCAKKSHIKMPASAMMGLKQPNNKHYWYTTNNQPHQNRLSIKTLIDSRIFAGYRRIVVLQQLSDVALLLLVLQHGMDFLYNCDCYPVTADIHCNSKNCWSHICFPTKTASLVINLSWSDSNALLRSTFVGTLY